MPTINNSFKSRVFTEEIILDPSGKRVGTIRISPASVKWKPKNAQKFYSIPLSRFIGWMVDPSTKARQTTS